MCETYNGWTNYETWVTNLWLTNDQDTFNRAISCKDSRELKVFTQLITAQPPSLSGDLIGSALGNVNWDEIYESLHEGDDQ